MSIEKEKLPIIALRGMTILPNMIIHFDLSRHKSILGAEKAMVADQRIFLVTQKNPDDNDPEIEDLYTVGTIAIIKQVIKLPENIVRVLVEGMQRANLVELDVTCDTYLQGMIEPVEEEPEESNGNTTEAMLRQIKEVFLEYSQYYPKLGKTILSHFDEQKQLGQLLDQIAINMPISYENKQKVLEGICISDRYEIIEEILANEIEIAVVKTKLANNIKNRVEKNQKEYILREQMNYIREELGEDGSFSEIDQFEADLKKLKAGQDVKDKIKKEIGRLKGISANSSESAVERGYIETLLELPWKQESKDNIDLTKAEIILNEDHYGMEKVKERMLEFLAVRTLAPKGTGPIICLVGPPGTGKTSIAKSVARALNKKYIRICLGGVRDEAEIRGHRKTYVGAMPGRIAVGLKQAKVNNPLMLLDEIDKISNDYKGDTFSALLEVLDSEQNSKFRDHYVELPLDLSNVFFIATANSLTNIPRPLLDRMEIIEVTSYTANEKFHIAKNHLLEKQLKQNGLDKERLSINDSALHAIIQSYTREAGVRELERKIGEIARKAAREILQKNKPFIRVTGVNLHKYLGKVKYTLDKANEEDEIGIVRGLAWTSVGGDTLQIEVNVMPGKGEIELTGQLGDVMKESALAGISYIRSISTQYKLATDYFKKHDFHIHIPEGAVPKDGPSAGITMATALLSAVTDTPVKCNVAMTGEITLRGRVLPIGGLKEKILAAKTAGIKTVIVPKGNEKDVQEISNEIQSGLQIIYAETMQDVTAHAFTR